MASSSTVSVKLCVALGKTPLEAVIVRLYTPADPAGGVPARVAVPLPLSVKETPLGSVPVHSSAGMGTPVAVMIKALSSSIVKLTLLALVIAGASGSLGGVQVAP